MVAVANRRSVMTLFSQQTCPNSHRVRFVLAEKGISNAVIEEVKDGEPCEDLVDLNPYNTIPTLVDRELVLYDTRIIIEYLDERFPHPPLMPVDPVSRARFRLALFRLEQDLYALVPDLESDNARDVRRAKKGMRESLLSSVDVFAYKPYFLSDEFSLVDCSIAPILWRLEQWGIDLPSSAEPIIEYGDRLFSREAFQASLSELELEMRSIPE